MAIGAERDRLERRVADLELEVRQLRVVRDRVLQDVAAAMNAPDRSGPGGDATSPVGQCRSRTTACSAFAVRPSAQGRRGDSRRRGGPVRDDADGGEGRDPGARSRAVLAANSQLIGCTGGSGATFSSARSRAAEAPRSSRTVTSPGYRQALSFVATITHVGTALRTANPSPSP
jgi:hypothetical protein